MKDIWNWIQIIVTALGGFIGWFLGGLDGFLYALIILIVGDYITGIMCAIVDKELSSENGVCGRIKVHNFAV
ncbi:phage holin family protein [Jeotgalibaca ciconiae]|uniref:phage holin family protein n=1 Tax=Jeotgalibaca ciconiae TaxID=2496265 RepID=UPI001D131D31|nr:phage holin family protein [Jeotgalibaca ciconiae]